MKRLNYLLVCLFSIFLMSCSRDDKNEDIQSGYNIEGTWMPTAMMLNGNFSQNGVTLPIKQDVPLGACERKTRLTFSANGAGHMIVYASEGVECEKKQEKDFTYVLNKKTGEVSVNMDNVVTKSRIISITADEIVSEEVTDKNIEGIVFTGTATTTYRKVK